MNIKLELADITKAFGQKIIYDNLSFEFKTGCYAIYGQNGIGKSVFLKMLAGVIKQDRGMIQLNAKMLNHSMDYKRRMVYVPSTPSFFPMVNGSEFLSFINTLKSSPDTGLKLQNQISGYKLDAHLSTPIGRMSLGTQKKLFLSTLAIGENDLIILDEPTTGLDDEAITFLIAELKQLSKKAIIIIATHDIAFMSSIDHHAIRLNSTPISNFN